MNVPSILVTNHASDAWTGARVLGFPFACHAAVVSGAEKGSLGGQGTCYVLPALRSVELLTQNER